MITKRFERAFFITLIVLAVVSLLCALSADHQRWISTSSVLIGLAGVVQLEISGLFERWIEKYGDEEKYYGPPSHITREIIDNPGSPIRTRLRNTAFLDKRTGFAK